MPEFVNNQTEREKLWESNRLREGEWMKWVVGRDKDREKKNRGG